MVALRDWLVRAVGEGRLSKQQARLRITAVNAVWSVLAADLGKPVVDGQQEQGSASWLRRNLHNAVAAFERAAPDRKPATVSAYLSRVTSALDDFQGVEKEKKVKPVATDRGLFDLGDGRVFEYRLPSKFRERDLERVYLHLLAQVVDLKPRPRQLRFGAGREGADDF